MTQPLVTIIMPLYNVSRYLERAVTSVVRQTYSHLEIVLVDDGSTDETATLMSNWAQQDQRIRCVFKANGGISDARNAGLAVAQGQYVTFVDGDDWVDPRYVESLVTQALSHQADLTTCGFVMEPPTETIKAKVSGERSLGAIMIDIVRLDGCVKGYTWNKLYRLAIIRQHHLQFATDLELMEDQVFNIAFVAQAQRFYCGETPLYHYVQRNSSATHSMTWTKFCNIWKANFRIAGLGLQGLGAAALRLQRLRPQKPLLKRSSHENNS